MNMTHKTNVTCTYKVDKVEKKDANSVINIATRKMTNTLPIYLVMN
jgi:hypothetical protein